MHYGNLAVDRSPCLTATFPAAQGPPVSACLTTTGCDNERTKYAQDNKGQRLTTAATETHRAETGAGVAIELILGPPRSGSGVIVMKRMNYVPTSNDLPVFSSI